MTTRKRRAALPQTRYSTESTLPHDLKSGRSQKEGDQTLRRARGETPLPEWTPQDLRAAYASISATQSEKWVAISKDAYISHRMDDGLRPDEYLLGIGKQSECIQILKRLGSDLRMKSVWARVSKLEAAARSGRSFTLLTGSWSTESLSCGIARICVRCVGDIGVEKSTTRKTWRQRHQDIAVTARRLATLLRPDCGIDGGLRNFGCLFTSANLRALSSQLYFELGPHVDAELEMSESIEEESRHEADTSDAAWDKELENWMHWVRDALKRAAPPVEELLGELARLAGIVAKNPPFLGHTSRDDRLAFNMCGSLYWYFSRTLGRPLDDVVACIVEVVTGRTITADSVKMMRHRYLKHSQRPLR
jgi:hypothetical protein